ncbi:MAG: ATP-binding protein [Lachnospiraceae bacterium]|nr:ATP-binding protein [Lachnospiraceae bacterium]
MAVKRPPVGIEGFEELRTGDFYFADKTGLIKELLDNWGKVNLFTRPRRFGKSLNMSMLKAFFEIGTDSALFDGLAISKETNLCEQYLGKFPVIAVTFKGVEGASYAVARRMAVDCVNEEARRFGFLTESENLTETEKALFVGLLSKEMDDGALISSLRNLTELLEKHYGRKAILLIDEYDVPLAKANEYGYYDEMIHLIRGMFGQALKTNSSLYFAVMTGCLHVAKESIFTGLNNLKMYTLLDTVGDEQFGFTDAEVRQLLEYYGFSQYYELTKEWYDGYRIGSANVYNPWDVINWCDQLRTNPDKTPKSYWANSSGNYELQRFIRRMGNGVTKSQIEQLISGESIRRKIEEQLTYQNMYDTVDNMWSLLFATGYLTQSRTSAGNIVRLMIPNTEVRCIFSDMILALFEKEVAADGVLTSEFCAALKDGDAARVESLFTKFMEKTVSIRDTAVRKEFKENFYHGILLGILSFKDGWAVDSNRESGTGYFDIQIETEDEDVGIIIEVKYAEHEKYDAACAEAMQQIEDQNYTAELQKDGMQTILKYGIACYRKQCRVVLEKEI